MPAKAAGGCQAARMPLTVPMASSVPPKILGCWRQGAGRHGPGPGPAPVCRLAAGEGIHPVRAGHVGPAGVREAACSRFKRRFGVPPGPDAAGDKDVNGDGLLHGLALAAEAAGLPVARAHEEAEASRNAGEIESCRQPWAAWSSTPSKPACMARAAASAKDCLTAPMSSSVMAREGWSSPCRGRPQDLRGRWD